MILPLKPELYL